MCRHTHLSVSCGTSPQVSGCILSSRHHARHVLSIHEAGIFQARAPPERRVAMVEASLTGHRGSEGGQQERV